MVRVIWTKFDRDWGWNLARLLAYACLTALFAVVGLQLAVLSFVLRITSDVTEHQLVAQLVRFLPDRVTSSALIAFTDSLERAPWPLVLLGLGVALWYGSRFFVVLESCLCIVFRRPKRSFRKQNRAALLLLVVFVVLLPIIILSATVTPHIAISQPHLARSGTSARLVSDPLFITLALLAGFAANFGLLLVAYTRLTPGGVSLGDAAPGALLGAVLAQAYLLVFPFYARYVLHPSQFGTIAGFALVALVFFFAYATFIVLGAELAALRAGYRPTAHDVTTLLSDLYVASRPLVPVQPQPSARLEYQARPAERMVWPDSPLPVGEPTETLG